MSNKSSQKNFLKGSDSDFDEGTPYQSLDGFIAAKQRALFNNHDISNIGVFGGGAGHLNNNYFSLS